MIDILVIAAGVIIGNLLYFPIRTGIKEVYFRIQFWQLKRKNNIPDLTADDIVKAAREFLHTFDYSTMSPDEPTARFRICPSCKSYKKNFTEDKKPVCFDCAYAEMGDETEE